MRFVFDNSLCLQPRNVRFCLQQLFSNHSHLLHSSDGLRLRFSTRSKQPRLI